MLSSSANAVLPSARPGRSHQLPRFRASRAAICCRNHGSGSAKLERSTDRLSRDAGILLGTAAFCLVSGFSVSDFARAEAVPPVDDVAALPASAIPDLAKKKRAVAEKPGKSSKVPSRVLRAKANERTLKAVLKTIEEEPGNLVAYKALLSLRMENGEVREAIEVLGRMIELEPEHLEYRFMRARAYGLVGDVRHSREEFRELVEIQPFSAKALQGLALAMEKDGEDDSQVLEMIHAAIKNAIDQQQSFAARNFKMLLGQILTSQEKLTQALEQYEELTKEDPSDFRPYLCQGLLYDSLGEKEKAKECYKRFKELCPESFPQRKYLDDLLVRGSYGARVREEEKEGKLASMQQPKLTMQDMAQASKGKENKSEYASK
ncbi:protein SLOW GREEN 1, chloroplastic-like [Selaginella moellendorffii]|uniref:protein SLOW GREEN 1, chloroplastic-like n=1 Tax=Selaginella moellendorffii TaxID=88036 RepID=UPI000D1CDE0D|nr:protein SLOW GREEN 1, chloroplastic-like [Selaginella moellendorffii]|eukprot:XP_024539887.1 protein SLOW GREEN 1, chloroplastic-like [Selaginella moellendorffii]